MSGFLAHLIDAEDLPGGGIEHDPLASDGANHNDLAIRGEAGGLGLLPNIITPHNSPEEREREYENLVSDDVLSFVHTLRECPTCAASYHGPQL